MGTPKGPGTLVSENPHVEVNCFRKRFRTVLAPTPSLHLRSHPLGALKVTPM